MDLIRAQGACRAAALAAVVVAGLAGSSAAQEPARPAAPAAPEAADTLPELLVEVVIERGASGPLLGLQSDSSVLLPLRSLLALAELRISEHEPERRVTWRSGDGTASGVLTAEARAYTGLSTAAIEPGAALWRGGELYVRLDLLAALLEVEAVMDWKDLMVRFSAAEHLPVVERVARERRRRVLLRAAEPSGPVTYLESRAPLVDGLAVDWSLTAATRQPQDNAGLALGVGAGVLGGGLDLQTSTQRTPRGTARQTLWQWSKAWEHHRLLRQVRLGDIVSGGLRAFGIEGAALTNAPFLREAAFAELDLVGRLPPGWEIEVYRGSELVGYMPLESGGAYAIGVPVVYGANPLETVAYGPGGEVRRSLRTFQIGFERLPARRFEYGVSGGRCQADRCRAMANFDLRYGVSDRLTLRAGADRFWRDTLADLEHPYALATVALSRPLVLTLEGVFHALARGRISLDPSPDLHLDAGYTRYDTTEADPLVGSAGVRDQADGSLFWRPGILGGEFYTQASASWLRGSSRSRTSLRLAGTLRLDGVRMTGSATLDEDRMEGIGRSRSFIGELGGDGVLGTGGPLRNTLLRGTVSAACVDAGAGCSVALTRWTAGLGRQLLRLLRLDLGLRGDRSVPGVTAEITLQLAMPWMRATSRNTVDRGAGLVGTQLFEGTVLWDRRIGRAGFASGRNLGRAGVAGVVFLDHNGNGRRDGQEASLPGVLLRVGSDAVVTDSLGRFSVWDLVPYAAAPVEVDTLALENPLWVPAMASALVVPSPNSFRFVEIPIQPGGEIAGRVELDGHRMPGATLTLRQLSTGITRRVVTFTDGTFYVMRLAPGRYALAPAEGLLEQLRAAAAPLEFEIGGAVSPPAEMVVRIERR